jgi:hypothetical protein
VSDLPVIGSLALLARTWQGRVILLVVTVQLLLPLSYYCARRDPHDERFAWRMFSPMRMARCNPRFTLDGRPVPLASLYHEAWIELAQRGRFAVIEAMGADLCAKNPGSQVRVTMDCSYLGAPPRTWGGSNDLCTTPEL